MPPLWQDFSRLRTAPSDSSSCRPPKASAPGTVRHFSCKAATSWGAAVGAMVPNKVPSSRWPRSRSTCGAGWEGRAPVVAVLLSRVERQTSPLLPQRARIRIIAGFSLQNRLFLGTAERGHDRLHGPPDAPTQLGSWDEPHAPVVAVLHTHSKYCHNGGMAFADRLDGDEALWGRRCVRLPPIRLMCQWWSGPKGNRIGRTAAPERGE